MEQKARSKLLSFVYLIRLNNCVISVLSVIVSAYIADIELSAARLIFAMFTVLIITAAGNIINDYYDIETDRINKPQRPLIAEKYNLSFVFILAIVMFAAGTGLSLFISPISFIIAVSASVLLFFYSKNFKRMPVIGNLVVAVLSSLLFIFGAIVGGDIVKGIFPAVFAFLMTFGREITKDIEDMEGDSISNMRTMPIVIGRERAFFIAVINFIILISLTFVPYFTGYYNKWYFFIVVFGVDLVLIILLLRFFLFDDIKTKRFVNNYLKYDMIIGLIAIVMGARW